MEKINLNDVEDLDVSEEKYILKNLNQKNLEFILSNPLKTEIVNFIINKNNEIEYEIQIMYKAEKWKLTKKLSDIISLLKNLKLQNFTFLNEAYFIKELDYYYYDLNTKDSVLVSQINENVKRLLNYINYRNDILLTKHVKEFFKINNFSFHEEFTKILETENLEQIFNFQVETSDMTLSDFAYNSDLGLLVIGLEDCSVLTTLGRFWSLIDYEVLGSILFYQRVYDKNNKPYFKKITAKSFDARVSKLLISFDENKIYVGLDNGTIQVFFINVIEKKNHKTENKDFNNQRKNSIEENKDNSNYAGNEEAHVNKENFKLLEIQNNKSNEKPINNDNSHLNSEEENGKIIVINEGIIFKPLVERITGLDIHKQFLFISSKDNKLVILDVTYNKPELRFNGSLKKRMEGKGYIKEIFIDKKTKNLYVITGTDKILIYKLTISCKNDSLSLQKESQLEIKIEYLNEINTIDNIKNYFLGNFNLFIATENKIQVCDLKKIKDINFNKNKNNLDEETNIIPFDGSLDEGISISSKFFKLDYSQGIYITSMSYFCDMKVVILGLNNGNLIGVSSKSLEVIFAKKISDNSLCKMLLLEERYVVIVSDEKGNIFFYQFGI